MAHDQWSPEKENIKRCKNRKKKGRARRDIGNWRTIQTQKKNVCLLIFKQGEKTEIKKKGANLGMEETSNSTVFLSLLG